MVCKLDEDCEGERQGQETLKIGCHSVFTKIAVQTLVKRSFDHDRGCDRRQAARREGQELGVEWWRAIGKA